MAETSSVTVWEPVKEDDSYETFWMPLLMSCIAGGSTCLGAAVVFCQGRSKIRDTSAPLVSEGQLSFSLSLAASVMITVSVISIGPECLSINAVSPSTTDTWISIWSMTFVHRLAAFALGCVLYIMLSCLAFPDADVILGLDQEQLVRQRSVVITSGSNSSSRSNSPLEWDNSETGVSVTTADGTPDIMEKGGEIIFNNSQDAQHMLTPLVKDTPTRPHSSRRSAVARQRRLSRKGSHSGPAPSSIHSDDDTTAATDISGSDDYMEPLMYYEKTSESNSASPFSRWWTRVKRSFCCCSNAVVGDASSSASPLPQLTLEQRRAWRVAMLLFVSLLCHNFPEGLAVAASALESHKLGMTVTIGIMIHNIPEGIAIAVPCLAARPHQPCLAFWLASLSGAAEPLGALLSLSVLRPLTTATAAAAAAVTAAEQEGNTEGGSISSVHSLFLPDGWLALIFTMENILAFVAGIMITVALMDLFPEAWRHSQQSKLFFISGTLAGITVMVATEWYLP